MPNWCVNQVEISGDPELVAKAVAFVASEDSAFAFEKIVPPPSGDIYGVGEGQNDFQCGCKAEYVGEAPNGKWLANGQPIPKVDTEGNSIKDIMDSMFGGTEVCPAHKLARISSHPDWWYNWNIKHWGTKWSARNVYASENSVGDYEFETAWGPSIPVSAALAKLFPGLTVTHRYCEGGNGYAGYAVFDHEGALDSEEYEWEELPEDSWIDGDRWERDYDAVPPTPFEKFAIEHFGGVVGG